jgi:hypothetical protein
MPQVRIGCVFPCSRACAWSHFPLLSGISRFISSNRDYESFSGVQFQALATGKPGLNRGTMGSILKISSPGVRLWQAPFVFLALLLYCHAASGQTYSCGSPYTNGDSTQSHCYAIAGWQEQPQYFGAYTDILQAGTNCPSGCDSDLSNEMWLVDAGTQACFNNSEQACWVEAGFEASVGNDDGKPHYFWADSRPFTFDPQYVYNVHYLGQADVADFAHFLIIKDERAGPDVYTVQIYNDSNTVFFTGNSIPNTMSANSIQIGSELAGTKGALGNAWFTRQLWATGPIAKGTNSWMGSAQTDIGSFGAGIVQTPPLSYRWVTEPTTPPPDGGLLQTGMCPPKGSCAFKTTSPPNTPQPAKPLPPPHKYGS